MLSIWITFTKYESLFHKTQSQMFQIWNSFQSCLVIWSFFHQFTFWFIQYRQVESFSGVDLCSGRSTRRWRLKQRACVGKKVPRAYVPHTLRMVWYHEYLALHQSLEGWQCVRLQVGIVLCKCLHHFNHAILCSDAKQSVLYIHKDIVSSKFRLMASHQVSCLRAVKISV